MKNRFLAWGIYCLLGFSGLAAAQQPVRLVVMTDIGGDPDDQQSLVRLLLHSDQVQLEGLLTSSRLEHGQDTRPDLIHEQLDAYEKVYPNLLKHSKNFPTPMSLRTMVKPGQGDQQAFGVGHDTPASDWLIQVVDQPDTRPVWVAVWGGQRELAQALSKVKATRSPEAVQAFVRKLRVYVIENQDGHERWILKNFPGLFLISAGYVNLGYPLFPKVREYSALRGMYMTGDESLTSRAWVQEHIRGEENPMAAVYPLDGGGVVGLKEGDTPSYIGLLPNGLNISERPDWGGFGGRFRKLKNQLYTDMVDFQNGVWNERHTVSRWRPYFQNDFIARLDWCVRSYAEANHHPVAVLNKQAGADVVTIAAQAGGAVKLSAFGSTDPDNHPLHYKWWNYWEAGSYSGNVHPINPEKIECTFPIPPDAPKGTVFHVILEVTDSGSPALTSFRRAVITVE
ncbi:uncharacterized protein DUF1593 [Dyadobacter jejuensis]|uniref:Uncharacterized protein DUF1593 n=1 Tax=Dyadobacter jejuensis TaxID=1082580 RepID=A0A316B4Q0_9BACT|nr:DUF1593 domain-containing protein [Dyadobacter jejuensis]PWJ57597.1 uncharacterized protein DUF1593 [Dyadobacter jejuensis]